MKSNQNNPYFLHIFNTLKQSKDLIIYKNSKFKHLNIFFDQFLILSPLQHFVLLLKTKLFSAYDTYTFLWLPNHPIYYL